MGRVCKLLLAIVALCWAQAAFAQVTIHFHSFNGSVLFGRYPHTFVVLDGTLEETGEPIDENYGFTAKSISPAILVGPVDSMIFVEKQDQIDRTNEHFSVALTDAQYWQIRSEVARWRADPVKSYDLNKRNCLHFVGALAQIAGLKVAYPPSLIKKPTHWLNYLARINPQLNAPQI
ncbi:hypothetical protein MKP08_02275 [Erythrobacter sp. LQ02-29]|uniref:hypothetical protein n=1 Tax=unclassified Erythrobacter TaxID=2633097 RepID=UPI001BFC9E11|nr:MULTISPECIES: hypothetical protein [unclassified Erythrobacter]MCP9221575.1 hypothetical protein [Erythrobacter sp. LQ02-29]QWC57165.1 hypothetical protein F7D01_08760 [Erythrobacter sp. 3-20A1M]|tara:strand:+ start:167 stop:694 length:528 start_codon:yes stop_codon:yes gene_type:complete